MTRSYNLFLARPS